MGTPASIKPEPKLGNIGPYRLLKPLAEGGMGIVYRAVHRDSQELVALKIVRVASEGLLASFRREIYALRSLAHPQVVRIVADGVHEGQPWYAMPILRGQTLGTVIDARHGRTADPSHHDLLRSDSVTPSSDARTRAEGRTRTSGHFEVSIQARGRSDVPYAETMPPPSERKVISTDALLTLMRALCQPLAYVHGRGVVHRDLKPDNVIVRGDGVPVLVDFGLVQLFGGGRTRDVLEVAGNVLGTPAYMAPEQIRGDLVDARADLYALGCIMYEALTGAVPFGGSASEILRGHLQHVPARPSQFVDGVCPELDELVLRLLEKEPRRRLGFAADVATALDRMGAAPPAIAQAPAAQTYLYRPALAGRTTLMKELEGLFDGRRGGAALIGGKSGVGKTRLAMELATSAARKGMTVVTAQCFDLRDGDEGLSVRAAPLHPFRPLLAAIVDRCRAGSRAAAKRILGAQAAVLAPYEPQLGEMLGAAMVEPPPLPPEATKLRLLDALAHITARFAATRPLFVVLDDLQWADELSLSFLHHIDGEYLRHNQLVLVGTYRDEEKTAALDELLSRDHIQNVSVGPLGRAAVDAMVGDMLALAEPPTHLVSFLMDESAGNPFFIAEYLRAAIGEHILLRDAAGEWVMGAGGHSPESLRSALPMPGGLRDLVQRRIAQVSPEARAVADMAAVLGKEIDGEVLLAALTGSIDVAPLSAPDSSARDSVDRRALEELRHRHILEEAELGHLRFTHDKLREYLYADIVGERRKQLHLLAAEHTEKRHRNNPELALHYPMLAHHYGLGGDVPRTIDYLELAGNHALDQAAPGEARRFFERAIELDAQRGDGERRGRWHRRLGEACYQTGDLDGAAEHLKRSLALFGVRAQLPAVLSSDTLESALSSAEAIGAQMRHVLGFGAPPSQRSETRVKLREAALAAERLSQVYYFRNEQSLAFGSALESAHYAEGLGPSPELARAYAVVGIALGFVPLSRLVERYGRRSVAIAEQVGDPHAIGFSTFLRGLAELNVGRHLDASTRFEPALAIAKKTGDVRAWHEIAACLGHCYNVSGRHERAIPNYRELLVSAKRVRSVQAEVWGLTGMAVTMLYLGRGEEALAHMSEATPLTPRTGDRAQQLVDGVVAEIKMTIGLWDEAIAIALRTLALSEGVRAAGYHPYFGFSAACEVLLGAWESALDGHTTKRSARDLTPKELAKHARKACDVLDRHARIFRLCEPQALRFRGLLHWLDDNPRRARRSWQRSLACATELAMPHDQARAHFELGRHLPKDDRGRRSHLLQARALWEGVDARYWLGRLLIVE